MFDYFYNSIKKYYNYIYEKLTELSPEEIEYEKYIQS